ncbi:glutamate--cysteine ligase [Francisellaceae bacterium]|nr:glutamate--cysteine ligase [Francisellaceae bacterium]
MLDKLDHYDFSLLQENKRGIERESLRVDRQGGAVKSKHPEALGEKLTNEFVTVDFSEELLELITPPFASRSDCFEFLKAATAYTQKALEKDEVMWSGSMPPPITEDDILIADFGTNVSAKMKEVYRKGLALRYGKKMQVIAGIHYNFSISEPFLDSLEIDEFSGSKQDRKSYLYFRLIKRYYQISWLLPYLFGCSPVCAKASVIEKPDYLANLDADHYFGEYATSLRMSDLGYQSKAQENLFISCENVDEYVSDLLKATDTRYPDYIREGVKDDQGEYQQLSDNILQIENEYYNTIRPKQIAKRCERPACALLKRGVEYVEVRLLDVDLFSEVGVAEDTGLFIEVFLMLCVLAPELKYNEHLVVESSDNFDKVVKYGRQPNLMLTRNKKEEKFQDWGKELLEQCLPIAKKMDEGQKGNSKRYQSAVKIQMAKLVDVSLTPSARILTEAKEHGEGYHRWLSEMSEKYAESLSEYDIPADLKAEFDDKVAASIEAWEILEQKDMGSFEYYIQSYFQSKC